MEPTLAPHKQRCLPPAAYSEVGAICSITAATRDRLPVFSDPGFACAGVEVLRERATETRVPVYGYCFMPDHLHLVIGPSPKRDVVSFVGQVKNLIQREGWKRGLRGRIWQESFWDHFLRGDEQVESVVEYVLNNPVRRGIVSECHDYPFAGSLMFDVRPSRQ